MDRLEALEVFVIAAKHRSFTAVSKNKNISASRVTHLIQGLEKELKVSLLIELPDVSLSPRRVKLYSKVLDLRLNLSQRL